MNDYLIIFETSATGWGAYAPDLPGVVAAGDTFEETEQLMREALEIHLESMLEDGDPIPKPTSRAVTMRPKALSAQLVKSA